jgi:hypothetical protein
MDIWDAREGVPPFSSHNELYSVIDSTTLGNVTWESFLVTYSGELPKGQTPPWMVAEYDVWYHNLHCVLRNQIANPDFCGEMDFAAKQVFDADNEQEYQDLMSGNWAWQQSVRIIVQFDETIVSTLFRRTSLPRTQKHMGQCLYQSFLAATR